MLEFEESIKGMFKPELSKSKQSLCRTRKTYSETRSEHMTIQYKKNLDRDIEEAFTIIKHTKSHIEKSTEKTNRCKKVKKANKDIKRNIHSNPKQQSKNENIKYSNVRMMTPQDLHTPSEPSSKRIKTGGSLIRNYRIGSGSTNVKRNLNFGAKMQNNSTKTQIKDFLEWKPHKYLDDSFKMSQDKNMTEYE